MTILGSPTSEGSTVQKLNGDGQMVAEYEVGIRPIALAFDGGSMWIANSGPLEDDMADSVTRLALDGTRLGEFKVGNGPVDILFDGETVWVANAGSNNVMRLSLTGLRLGRFDVGKGPCLWPSTGRTCGSPTWRVIVCRRLLWVGSRGCTSLGVIL